jgi:hypothetical protein
MRAGGRQILDNASDDVTDAGDVPKVVLRNDGLKRKTGRE